MLKIYAQVVHREIAIQIANKTELAAVLLFYIIVISLFPIALGPFLASSTWVAPAIIWVAALLTTFLVQENMLRADYNNGIFEQMQFSAHSMSLLLFAKICAQWLVFALPMVMLTPILAMSLGLPATSIVIITISLILGTITLSLVGALGAALTISMARGGVLLAILILPLYIPVLVLGTGITTLSLDGIISIGHLALLGALAVTCIMLVPFAVCAAIRVSLN
jgi:heme exporter protein B